MPRLSAAAVEGDQPRRFRTSAGAMDRRRFVLTSLAGALVPLVRATAQPATLRRIGYVANVQRTPVTDSFQSAFVAGLREHGWIESQNVVIIERRLAEFREDLALAA